MPDEYDEEAHSGGSGGDKPKKHKHKHKHKSKSKSVEDAIEQKLREKKKKEKAAAAAEDALEAKIRAKQRAADGEVNDDVEEGLSASDKSLDKKPPARTKSSGSSKASKKVQSRSVPGGTALGIDTASPLFASNTSGGGDVRNRPPPSLQTTPEVDPLRAAEEEKKKNTKQVNKRYADLHETGQWGGLSKWEKYGLCLLALGAIGAIWDVRFLWFLLALISLFPWPAPGRKYMEMRGFAMTIAADNWADPAWKREEAPNWILDNFTGPNYYWMWPFRKHLEGQFKTWITWIDDGTIDEKMPLAKVIRNKIQGVQ